MKHRGYDMHFRVLNDTERWPDQFEHNEWNGLPYPKRGDQEKCYTDAFCRHFLSIIINQLKMIRSENGTKVCQ